MKKIIVRGTHKLSLSSETLRKLSGPALARAQGGGHITVSYCFSDLNGNGGPGESHGTDNFRSGGPTEGSHCLTAFC